MLRILGLLGVGSGRWVALVAVVGVVVGAPLGSLGGASAGRPLPDMVDFSRLNAHRPVAGHLFEGLTIINRTGLVGTPHRFSAVRCDAVVGGKRLHAKQLVYGEPRRGYLQVIVCGWRIPPDAAGKTLRFSKNAPVVRIGHVPCGTRTNPCRITFYGPQAGPPWTWRVRSR